MLTIKLDTSRLEKQIEDVARKQVPFAMSRALNDAGKDGIEAIEQEIQTSFDRPTRFTQKAFFVTRSTKQNLRIRIARKSMVAGRHYLEVQQAGRPRPQTGLERLLTSRLKYGGVIQSVTPAKGARLTTHGNWSPAQRNQVLSAVQPQGDSRTNTTAASRKRNKGRAGYFVPRAGSKLSPGIYQRMARGRVKKIVHITPAVSRYTKRFRFYEVAHKSIRKNLPRHFALRFRQAMATAK